LKNNRLIKIILVLACLILVNGCISGSPGVESPNDIIHFPIGVAIHPAGRYAAVVNADFSQAYQNGTVVIINLASNRIVSNWTIPIGPFGGEVAFNHSGNRMFVAVRGALSEMSEYENEPTDVVVSIEVDLEVASKSPTEKPFFLEETRIAYKVAPDPFGLAIDASDHYVYVTHISNGEVTVIENQTARPVNPELVRSIDEGEILYRCIPENLQCPAAEESGLLCGPCNTDDDCAALQFEAPGADDTLVRFTEPSYCMNNPNGNYENYCATYCEVDKTVFNEYGDIVRVGCPDGYRCSQVRDSLVLTERKMARGSNQAAISPLTGSVYISHRNANSVGVMRPYYEEGTGYQLRVEEVPITSAFDTRGLAFSNDGSKLYVATRNVSNDSTDFPGIVVLDTTIKYEDCSVEQYISNTSTCEENESIDFIEVDQSPANIAIYKDYLYVALFDTDEVYAIDTRTRQVMAVINLAPENFIAEAGIFREDAKPYDIAIYENSTGAWALTTNFYSHEVAVIHLFDENGKAIHKVERKIENRAKLYDKESF